MLIQKEPKTQLFPLILTFTYPKYFTIELRQIELKKLYDYINFISIKNF